MLRCTVRVAAAKRSSALRCQLISSPCRLKYKQYSLLKPLDTFERRHIGPSESELKDMLKTLDLKNLDDLVEKTIPKHILLGKPLDIDDPLSESELLDRVTELANKNKVYRNFIGTGYTNTVVPQVIKRNILENPGWYTQYTPYQAEIAQGRLQSLLAYQTMVSDLTGLEVSNSSLLDESTAAAEAMAMCFDVKKQKQKKFIIDENSHPQNIALLKTRAVPFGIEAVVTDVYNYNYDGTECGVLIQYPDTNGTVTNLKPLIEKVHNKGGLVVCTGDLMSLTKLTPPGDFGADIAVGNSQRYGVPLGYGGPHGGYLACHSAYIRRMAGRITGVSKDAEGNAAKRLALQTREQHIRREKATSNICTAQALLANMSVFYAIYHGPKGLTEISNRIHLLTITLADKIEEQGHSLFSKSYYDTLRVTLKGLTTAEVLARAEGQKINLRYFENGDVGIQLDESVNEQTLIDLMNLFCTSSSEYSLKNLTLSSNSTLDDALVRKSTFLTDPVFNSYHSEHLLLRYAKKLENMDLSLAHSMIPLGSCTMKLNATTEMVPVTMPEFANIHPFAPFEQTKGYHELMNEFAKDLATIGGYEAVSLQPNSGAQGEYAGLRAIRAYLDDKGEGHRNICLIPSSAHGTNPASAGMCSMKVVSIKTDHYGNVDMGDLQSKVEKHSKNIAAIMITYPSTYGVFETKVNEVCDLIHQHGGQVYIDGANMNALTGLVCPGKIGADVSHFNLHKTFCIPHGGGGPGMGPIGVKAHLAPYLPGHPCVEVGGEKSFGTVSAGPWGSPSILPISWAYIKMMGSRGLANATKFAILNANYMCKRLEGHYKVLYKGEHGMCAHEFILDTRIFSKTAGIEVIDIAKRLQDYGFHAPTMSWPVANTLMFEPTESESKDELDRYCDAMLSIREEIREIEEGKADRKNNVLKNAPHTMEVIMNDQWDKPYSRSKAVFPLEWIRENKFWPTVSRVDDVYGDRHLICRLSDDYKI